MKVAILLAFLAVARAAYFDEGMPGYGYNLVSPAMTRAMFHKYGFAKPPLDAHFISFGRSLGASDPAIYRMHSLYDEPAVLFFLDPTDGVVSYYADAGVGSAMLSPELRSVFPSVLGASDSLAIVYQPESFLGSYKSVLPGHFFVPSQSHMMAKALRGGYKALPLPVEHAIFKKSEIADIFPEVSPIYARFDIDEFPFAYKSPVALSLFNADHSVGYPSSAVYAKAAYPMYLVPHMHSMYANSVLPYSASYFKSGYPFIRSEMSDYHHAYPLIRSYMSDYHYAYIPVLKFPYAKYYASYEPMSYPSYKMVHYPYHVSPVSPIGAHVTPIAAPIAAPIVAPVIEPAAPVDSEMRSFPYYIRSFPGFYPSYPSYPALRYPAPVGPIYQAPIAPATSGVAGASSSASASASSMAGAAGVAPIY